MAADWKEQYLAALSQRDIVEQANIQFYDHCERLQDQKVELQQKLATAQALAEETKPPLAPVPAPLVGTWRVSSPPARSDSPGVVQMREDLAKAQKERADLQVRLDNALRELDALRSRSKTESKQLLRLTTNVNQLTIRLKDRDEELRGKAKLVEDVQDENVTLNLQLNMAEDRTKRLQEENQQLVDRWMTRMGKEAERMNEQHKFG